MILSSVTTAETSSAGVMSKAKFSALVPSGAAGTVISSARRRSSGMRSPLAVAGSIVDSGAATTNGIPARRAASASEYVPILLATSPLAATRSAPTTTASAMPWLIMKGAAPSHTR